MGSGSSASRDRPPLKPLVEPVGLYFTLVEKKEFECIGYTDSDLKEIAQLVQSYDKDLANLFSIKEFMKCMCGMKKLNDISKRLFNVPLGKKDRQLTFREFILFIWRFLTLSSMEMYEFTFELYDPERTGELRFSQVRALIRIIHDSGRDGESKKGEHLKKGHQDPVMKQLGQFLDILGIPDEARITRTNFVGICEKFPALVSPVVTLQKKLKEALFGVDFWNKLVLFRLKSGPDAAAIHYDLLQATVALDLGHGAAESTSRQISTYSEGETPLSPDCPDDDNGTQRQARVVIPGVSTAEVPPLSPDRPDDDNGTQRQARVAIPGASAATQP